MLSRVACLVLVAALAAAPPVSAGEIELFGFVFGRGIGVGGQPPWIEGGFGRLTEGADSPGESTLTARGKVHVGLDWEPTESLLLHLHGLARAEPGAAQGWRAGVTEAFLQWQPELSLTTSLRLRVGTFFPGTSLENPDPLWSSPYTITLSALNSWTAEELRLTGLDGRLLWSDGRDVLHAGGAAFVANDTLGTLIAWRGWSMSDRFTVIGELLPLPPLFSLEDDGAFHKQRDDGTRPIDELDGRVGWMARAGWRRLERLAVQGAYIDNRGDPAVLERGQYAWRTRFWVAGGELMLGPSLRLLAEGAGGDTEMGLRSGDHVFMDFLAGYAMLSWEGSSVRVTLRYDRFENSDGDGTAEDNSEDGSAWTLAAFWHPTESLRVGAELLDLRSERPAAAQSGADPDTDAWKATLEARLSF